MPPIRHNTLVDRVKVKEGRPKLPPPPAAVSDVADYVFVKLAYRRRFLLVLP